MSAHTPAMTETPGAVPAGPRRRWLVYVILAVIVVPHLYEVAVQKEHWPFSPYQMWSKPSVGWDVKREMLRGVTADGREVPLTPKHLYPIPYQMVVVNMQHASKAVSDMESATAESAKLAAKGDAAGAAEFTKTAERKKADADRIVGGLLEHYTQRLEKKQHDGPPLMGIRLYQVTWGMDLNNVEASRANPKSTVMLYQGPAKAEPTLKAVPVSTKITAEFGDDSNSD
jgi:hypothetical protein